MDRGQLVERLRWLGGNFRGEVRPLSNQFRDYRIRANDNRVLLKSRTIKSLSIVSSIEGKTQSMAHRITSSASGPAIGSFGGLHPKADFQQTNP